MIKANPASVPRSEKIIGRADCPAGSSVGDLVYITAAKIGNVHQVGLSDPSVTSTLPVVATIIKLLTTTSCFVQFHGPVQNVYAGLTPGAEYYLGTDGTPATAGDVNFPVVGGSDAFQQIGVATSDDVLLFHTQGSGDAGSGPTTEDRYNVVMSRVDDRTWSTPDVFLSTTIRVYHNGRRLELALSDDPVMGDFYVLESGGAGTGFDTVRLLRFSTNAWSKMRADYVAVV